MFSVGTLLIGLSLQSRKAPMVPLARIFLCRCVLVLCNLHTTRLRMGCMPPPPLGPTHAPPSPKRLGQIFFRASGQLKIFFGAFGANQFRPKNFFGAVPFRSSRPNLLCYKMSAANLAILE